MIATESIVIELGGGDSTSGIWMRPDAATACLVLAHGAGVGMEHTWMSAVAAGLAERRIATLRFNFPYMERGSRRTDSPPVAQAAVRAAVKQATELAPDLPIAAGGKSFGGRMTSLAQSTEPLPQVTRLVFFGFPLHPANKPGISRADHLSKITIPMLFLQGTRDDLAEIDLITGVVDNLGSRASVVTVEGADHSFHVLKSSGRTDAQVMSEILDTAEEWILALG